MRNGRITTALLAALGLAWITAGCAGRGGPPDPAEVARKLQQTKNDERALVEMRVADPERAERVIGLLDERDRLVTGQAERVAEHWRRMGELNADHAASREDFERAVAGFNRDRQAWQRRMVELLAEMKAATDAEEWKRISKFQLKKLDPRNPVYAR